MGVPRLGREPLTIEEANRIYEDAQLLFKRYDPNSSLDPSEVGAQMTVDPNNFAVRSSDAVISVVRGNVFARDSVIKDMTRIGALEGRMAELVADLDAAAKIAKQNFKRIEGRLYNDYTRKVHSPEGLEGYENVPKTKMTKDNLTALAINDPEHIKVFEDLVEFERNTERATATRNSLGRLENDLKKALEHGEKAQ